MLRFRWDVEKRFEFVVTLSFEVRVGERGVGIFGDGLVEGGVFFRSDLFFGADPNGFLGVDLWDF